VRRKLDQIRRAELEIESARGDGTFCLADTGMPDDDSTLEKAAILCEWNVAQRETVSP
jgi:hypothetical protein